MKNERTRTHGKTWDSNCERIIISTEAIVANAFIHFMESLKLTLRGIKSESGRTAESSSSLSSSRRAKLDWRKFAHAGRLVRSLIIKFK